ncbi:MAG: glycosyltransferase family 9 protein [Candidatus Lernaella stagnicola]|nr:glycosyltransferase family 9 protein [Candidatus Lernaella stagnicola]
MASGAVSLIRRGAAGDILRLEPIVAELKRRGVTVYCHSAPRHRAVVQAIGARFRRTDDRPIGQEIDLSTARESVQGPVPDGVDAFCRAAGIWPRRKTPTLPILGNGSGDRALLAVVPFSACRRMRSLTDDLCAQFLEGLVAVGWRPVIFGRRRPRVLPSGVIDRTGKTKTILEAGREIARCGRLMTVDTGLLHVAGALRVPTLVLVGPFPASAVIPYYPTVVALEAGSRCAPCYAHGEECRNELSPYVCMDLSAERLTHAVAVAFGGEERRPVGSQPRADTGVEIVVTKNTPEHVLQSIVRSAALDGRVSSIECCVSRAGTELNETAKPANEGPAYRLSIAAGKTALPMNWCSLLRYKLDLYRYWRMPRNDAYDEELRFHESDTSAVLEHARWRARLVCRSAGQTRCRAVR